MVYLTGSHGRLAPPAKPPGYVVEGKTFSTATEAWQAALAVCSSGVSEAARRFDNVRLAMLEEVNTRRT